jgi:hypothetical protein
MSDTRGKQDIRRSEVPLGKRVGLNLTPPPHIPDETIDEFYARLRVKNMEAGDVMMIHTFYRKDGKDYNNMYTVGHEFISLIMQEKNAFCSPRLNIGGLACLKCTRVHYFDMIAKFEAEWKKDKDGFDRRVLNSKNLVKHEQCGIVGVEEEIKDGY